MTPIQVLAPAKLNLTLRVLAREESGFHQLETLFCALDLADEIEIRTDVPGLALHVLAPPESAAPLPDLGPDDENLALRAARSFFDASGREPAAAIRLVKRIPSGAGLGGGSSDAAAVLAALNGAFDQPLPLPDLLALGAGLGSDVPFFLTGSALALAWGRGGRLLPLPPLPSAPVILAVPDVPVATPDAYRWLAASRDGGATPAALFQAPATWTDVRQSARNDFEDAVFPRLPRLRQLREAMDSAGALVARMTGSGSVVFGVFDESEAAQRAAAQLREAFPDVAFVLTRTASGAVPRGVA